MTAICTLSASNVEKSRLFQAWLDIVALDFQLNVHTSYFEAM